MATSNPCLLGCCLNNTAHYWEGINWFILNVSLFSFYKSLHPRSALSKPSLEILRSGCNNHTPPPGLISGSSLHQHHFTNPLGFAGLIEGVRREGEIPRELWSTELISRFPMKTSFLFFKIILSFQESSGCNGTSMVERKIPGGRLSEGSLFPDYRKWC